MRKWYEENRERIKEKRRKFYKNNREKILETHRNNYQKNIEKERKKARKYREKNPEKNKKWREENREHEQEYKKMYQKKNREHLIEYKRMYRKKNPEKIRKWREENPESVKAHKKKYYKKNPPARTEEMTEYRRSHRECEWSDCDRTESLNVHHILSKHKYPEYIDGNYHGHIGNNFICFCVLHHFAYHYAYSTTRNDKKHQNPLSFIWANVELWASHNKISIKDLRDELTEMLKPKVIFAYNYEP